MEINFLKKEKKFKKKKAWFDLNLYWRLSVGVMFMATLASFFFGYYTFMKLDQEFNLPVLSTSGQVETVKRERIEKVLEYFALREKKSDQILISPIPVVDPSL